MPDPPPGSVLNDAAAALPRVTASIPYFRCKPYVRRAVESLLEQTYARLRVVVVNDGDPDPPWDALAELDDPRLTGLDLPGNHGPFFAHAVVLEATSDPYFLTQDADDWSEPGRVAALMDALRGGYAQAAISAKRLWNPAAGGAVRGKLKHYPDVARPLTKHYAFRATHHGLFRTEALRAIGGYYGGFRLGYDRYLMNMMLMTGRVACIEEPLYNALRRPDSLSRAAETGGRSAIRLNTRRQMERLYQEAFGSYTRFLDGRIDEAALTQRIRELSRSGVGERKRKAIEHHARRLRELLTAQARRRIP